MLPADLLPPRCAVHGEMRYRPAGHWWVCPGWDGEGCCAVGAELVMDATGVVFEPDLSSGPLQWGCRRAVRVGLRLALLPDATLSRPGHGVHARSYDAAGNVMPK